MSIFVALLLVVSALASAVENDNPQYLITTPYQYRAGQSEIVTVHLFGSKSCEVEVRLKNPSDKIVDSANGTFTPGEVGELTLRVPDFAASDYAFFHIEATVCGVKTSSRTLREIQQRPNIIFIQTDKPIYKPGQKIRMRILSLDKDLKPTGDKVDKVDVVASACRIKAWQNVTLEDGMASLELQLSKEPILGYYKITAVIGNVRRTQTIEIAKYVLPKFEVKITLPSYMALDQKEFTTTICAKYTYGKNVKGTLNTALCLDHRHRFWQWGLRRYLSQDFKKCQNITKEIDGCTDITVPRSVLGINNIASTWGTSFAVDASVTETLTGVTLKKSAIKLNAMQHRSVRMTFAGTSDKFKPGLPFKYMLKVTRPDGSPATGAKVRVTISRGYYNNQFYNKTFVITNGFIKDDLNDATYNARNLHFEAKLLDKNPYPVQARTYPVSTWHTARPWYSPSFSYLEMLNPLNTPVKIDSEASLTVRYTVRNNTGEKVNFHYSIMCKGNLVKTGMHTQFHEDIQDENHQNPTTTSLSTTDFLAIPQSDTKNKNETSRLEKRMIAPWVIRKPDPVKTLDTRPVIETFDIKFLVTLEMVPSCRVMMYYVRDDKEVVADTIDFDVEDKLENQVSVSFSDDEKKPGEKTKLILKATPGSRVAFVAVDKSIHLLKSGNELTKAKIRPYLNSYHPRADNSNPKCSWDRLWRGKRSILPYWGDRSDYEDASEAFNAAGLIFLSNLSIFTKPCARDLPVAMLLMSEDVDGIPDISQTEGRPRLLPKNQDNARPVKVRKEFPETWLWADEKLDESGNKTLQVTVPDTITTWVANGFAMSSATGLGISDTETIKAFQPFFVQMTLPYSVIRGEEIPVTVTVFNYMESCVPIKMQMNHKSLDYKVTSYHINKMCVCGDGGRSVKFMIIPTNLGHIPLTVLATTSSANLCGSEASKVTVQDAVTRKLLVEPEGIRKEYTQGTFFCPKDGKHTETFDLRVPKDVVPGSVYPRVTIIGDLMGPALNNLDDLLRMPYGCGEQNMANFAPNIYIMDYLTKTHQVTEAIKNKAENFMEVGYQRELTYKRKNGSYSAFGNHDKQGSMMLTAFVVRSFARAKKYIFVDNNEVKHSIEWFREKQQENGCFQKYGRLFNRGLQGGVNSELTITAYVTTALLEAGLSTNSTMVSLALSCITSKLDSIKDSYTTALITYTLTLAKHSEAPKMMKLLKSKAVKKDDVMYWTGKSTPKEEPKYYYYRSSAEVEMTAYALLAILHQSDDDKSAVTAEVMNIIRWLSKQRNSYGGFASTQDTCVALQALSEFAGKAYGSSADFRSAQLTGSLKMGNYYNRNFQITKENRLNLQIVELPAKIIPGKLEVSGEGAGCALIQASLKYNVPEPEDIPVFDIKVDVRTRRSALDEEITSCSPLRLDITTKWLKEDVSNMAVVDIKLVTGFSVREKSLEKLRSDPKLNFKRFDIDGQNVQLYFDEIKDITFSVDIHQDTLVKKLKPAVVKVYDYYEPESQAKVMYKIGDAECYGNKIDIECPKCMALENPDTLIKAILECNSTVTRMKSLHGMMKVIKTYSPDVKKQNNILKKEFEYQIPEFCPCEEIYDSGRAIVIGQGSYFKVDGAKTTVVLNAGTTVLKYTGKSMQPQVRKILKKLRACEQ